MAASRLAIIAAMALVSYALRVMPQLLLAGWSFPPAWDRYLRYLAYALVAGIVSATLFLASGRGVVGREVVGVGWTVDPVEGRRSDVGRPGSASPMTQISFTNADWR